MSASSALRAGADTTLGVAAVLAEAAARALLARGDGIRRRAQGEVSRALDELVPPVVDAVLDRVDLTAIVVERVDLDRVVQQVLARLDLVGLAEYVVDAIDLPQIIRDSSGALTSDTIRGVRMRGVAGDRAIQRVRDRVLRHEADGGPATPEPS